MQYSSSNLCTRNSIFPHFVMVSTCCGSSCGLWLCADALNRGAPKIFRRLLRRRNHSRVEISRAGPITVQWASRKKRISYDFNSYVGSMRHIPKTFRSASLSTATQPWWSADRPGSQRRHGFISSTPGNPKIAIGSKYHTWLIFSWRGPRNHFWFPLAKSASFALAINSSHRKLQPHAADAK
jgi:hypothetical protein